MKTSYAFLALGSGILLYIWAAVSCHSLSLYSNRPAIGTGVLVGIAFIVLGVFAALAA